MTVDHTFFSLFWMDRDGIWHSAGIKTVSPSRAPHPHPSGAHVLITRPRLQLVCRSYWHFCCLVLGLQVEWIHMLTALPTVGNTTVVKMSRRGREKRRRWCVLCLGMSGQSQTNGRDNYHRLIISQSDKPMIVLLIKCTISSWETAGSELMCFGTYLVSLCWVSLTSVCIWMRVRASEREREECFKWAIRHRALLGYSCHPHNTLVQTHSCTRFSHRKTSRSGRVGCKCIRLEI